MSTALSSMPSCRCCGYLLSVSLSGNINILNRNSSDASERTIQTNQVSITALQ